MRCIIISLHELSVCWPPPPPLALRGWASWPCALSALEDLLQQAKLAAEERCCGGGCVKVHHATATGKAMPQVPRAREEKLHGADLDYVQ